MYMTRHQDLHLEFKLLSEEEKNDVREAAIDQIATYCHAEGKAGIVTGHFMFWNQTIEPFLRS